MRRKTLKVKLSYLGFYKVRFIFQIYFFLLKWVYQDDILYKYHVKLKKKKYIFSLKTYYINVFSLSKPMIFLKFGRILLFATKNWSQYYVIPSFFNILIYFFSKCSLDCRFLEYVSNSFEKCFPPPFPVRDTYDHL